MYCQSFVYSGCESEPWQAAFTLRTPRKPAKGKTPCSSTARHAGIHSVRGGSSRSRHPFYVKMECLGGFLAVAKGFPSALELPKKRHPFETTPELHDHAANGSETHLR